MATNLVLNDVVLARVETSMFGQTSINDYFYQVTAVVGTGITDVVAASDIDLHFEGIYKPMLSTLTTYQGVRLNRANPNPTPSITSFANTGVGSDTSGVLPTQCAAVITKHSPIPGRAGRGRVYFPFPCVDHLVTTTGDPTGGYLTSLNTLGTAIASALAAGSGGNTCVLVPVLYNRVSHAVKTVLSATASGFFGTQRRRGAYGRPNLP